MTRHSIAVFCIILIFFGFSTFSYLISRRFVLIISGFAGYVVADIVGGGIIYFRRWIALSGFLDQGAHLILSAIIETSIKIALLVVFRRLYRKSAFDNAMVVSLALAYAACEVLVRDLYNIMASFHVVMARFEIYMFGDRFMAPYHRLVEMASQAGVSDYYISVACFSVQVMAVVVMHVSTFLILFRIIHADRYGLIFLGALAVVLSHAGSDMLAVTVGGRYGLVEGTVVWICLAAIWISVAYAMVRRGHGPVWRASAAGH